MTPDLSTLWVVFFLLLCTALLNTLIFKPLLQAVEQRSTAVRDARELAQSAAQKAAEASAEYDRTLNAARAEVYKHLDDTRRAALDKRAALLAETRASVEKDSREALAAVRKDSAAAREALDREADTLATAIVTRVLGRAS